MEAKKTRKAIGRVYCAGPTAGERFYLLMLYYHRWKAEIYSYYPRFITVESAHYTRGIHHYAQIYITMHNCAQVTQV
jgi:hypothetical protein